MAGLVPAIHAIRRAILCSERYVTAWMAESG
jgi:hypothetical protein